MSKCQGVCTLEEARAVNLEVEVVVMWSSVVGLKHCISFLFLVLVFKPEKNEVFDAHI